MNVLLLGCGHSRERRLMLKAKNQSHNTQIPIVEVLQPSPKEWPEGTVLHTWDINLKCNPTLSVNLNTPWRSWNIDTGGAARSIFATYDEVHAYEVLEHLGTQGDAASFFNTFVGIWHLLKPGGILFATVPHYKSEWAWGDPSHRRVITPGSLVFLSKKEYAAQLGKTPMSDFRELLGDVNFDIVNVAQSEHTLYFALRAV